MLFIVRRFFFCFLAALGLTALAAETPSLSRMAIESDIEYIVQPGDILAALGARFGIDYKLLAQQNNIPNPDRIYAGRKLRVHSLQIVPMELDDGVLINIPQRTLFYFEQGKLITDYPVGLGKPTWPTPVGKFKIYMREMNKAWKVPKSIQEEMRNESKTVLEEVPPGPDNPLGAHWLGLTLWGYGIHGTIAPSSVYRFQSHGCIRLHPDDVAELFDLVEIGTPGRIIYQTVMMAVIEDGRILLEVFPDIYEKGIDPLETVLDMAEANNLSEHINWPLVEEVIAAQDGLAREVGRLP